MTNLCGDRIVVLIDMDCFFCQVETKLQPEFKGKPLAVVQYNQWKLGGIIAVNYEARDYGVTRHMRGDEAKEKCPDLLLASVPCLRGKADTSRYRTAGREVIDVIRKHCNIIERASVDEAYLDITDIVDKRMTANNISPNQLAVHLSNTFIVGHSEIGKNDEEERSKGLEVWMSNIFDELDDIQSQKLAVAGMIVEEIRADIFEKTGYRCSAGIAQNKILAKLACGLHKPNRQTILPPVAVSELYSTLPVKKVRNLGGKFGDVLIDSLNCNVMGDLLRFSLQYLQKRFDEKTGLWLYNIARGVDNEPVTTRLVSKSIGACKKFPGKQAIVTMDVLKHWAGELSAEVCERLEQDLEENARRATLVTICYHYYQNRTTVSQSRSCTLTSYNPEKMASRCVDFVTKSTQCPVAYLGISAGKFVQVKGSENLKNYFKSNKSEDNKNSSMQLENKKEDKHESRDITRINITATDDNIESSDLKQTEVNKTCEKLAPRLASTPNDKSDESPTSRRVIKLIQFLNERNSSENLHKNVINKNNLSKSFNSDKFKESFFMNAFNDEEGKSESNECINEDERQNANVIINDDKNVIGLSKNNQQITKFENYEDLVAPMSDSKNNYEDKNTLELYIEDYKNAPSTSYKSLNNHYENEGSKECNSVSNAPISKAGQSAALANSSVRLQELFPDLNNIDASVVAILPLDLQEEAKRYMKKQTNNNLRVTENITKNSKQKNNKSKFNLFKGKKEKNISTFLIKGNSINIHEPLTICTQCQKMIPVTKYDLHKDFHVAENLQKELNNTFLNNTGGKRKIDTSGENSNSVKRRPNATIKLDKLKKNN